MDPDPAEAKDCVSAIPEQFPTFCMVEYFSYPVVAQLVYPSVPSLLPVNPTTFATYWDASQPYWEAYRPCLYTIQQYSTPPGPVNPPAPESLVGSALGFAEAGAAPGSQATNPVAPFEVGAPGILEHFCTFVYPVVAQLVYPSTPLYVPVYPTTFTIFWFAAAPYCPQLYVLQHNLSAVKTSSDEAVAASGWDTDDDKSAGQHSFFAESKTQLEFIALQVAFVFAATHPGLTVCATGVETAGLQQHARLSTLLSA
ncbi:MAG: hypothetical protein ACOYUB_00590 [Patescibacteria group bacterium]